MPYTIRSLVVGVAELDTLDPTLHHGLELAERLGATLHLVHAYSPPDVIPEVAPPDAEVTGPPVPFPAIGAGIELERTLKERLDRTLAGERIVPRIVPHFRSGAAHRALEETAAEVGAQLILVGSSRKSQVAGALLGTTAARIARSASVPVLVHRAVPGHPDTRVLLTTDLSELSRRCSEIGLETALGLFGRDQVRFRCLLAVNPGSVEQPPFDADRLRAGATPSLERFAATLASPGTSVSGVVRVGAPVDEIGAEASEWPADLVVLGTHGRSGISRLFLGSVAEATIRDLRCSALVIPARGLEPSPEA